MAQDKACGPFTGDGVTLAGGSVYHCRDTASGANDRAGERDGQESVFQGRLIN